MNINSLYQAARIGDAAAEDKLFKYLTVSFRLFTQQRIGNDQDAEEIVQDAIMTILQKYKGITFEVSFAAWAYRVLNNKILDYIKRKKTHRAIHSMMASDETPVISWQPDPELKKKLMDCFSKMNEVNKRHARVLNLHYQGYTTVEICKRIRMTANHFYVMLSRARAMLEACLAKEGIAP